MFFFYGLEIFLVFCCSKTCFFCLYRFVSSFFGVFSEVIPVFFYGLDVFLDFFEFVRWDP